MSPDPGAASTAGPRWGRRLLVVGLALLALLALAVWLAFPWGRIDGLVVENARILAAGEPDGSRKPAAIATPRRIMVTFSTANDLARERADADAGFIRATLFACADDSARNSEVVSQRSEYFGDYGRVQALGRGNGDGPYRYRAVFDDRLTRVADNSATNTVAIGTAGGLCFTLEGGSMWLGKMWSDQAPLRLDAGENPPPPRP